jgi:hypothetical protein
MKPCDSRDSKITCRALDVNVMKKNHLRVLADCFQAVLFKALEFYRLLADEKHIPGPTAYLSALHIPNLRTIPKLIAILINSLRLLIL